MLGYIPTLLSTLRPRASRISFDLCSPQWLTTTFFANSLQSSILRTDMRCGSQAHGNRTGPWKLATSVLYAMADFIAFSMFCVPQKDNPTCQSTMNNFAPRFQIISAAVPLVPAITVRPELACLNKTFMPQGNCGLLGRFFTTDIITAQVTFANFHLGTQAGEEVQYYPSR